MLACSASHCQLRPQEDGARRASSSSKTSAVCSATGLEVTRAQQLPISCNASPTPSNEETVPSGVEEPPAHPRL